VVLIKRRIKRRRRRRKEKDNFGDTVRQTFGSLPSCHRMCRDKDEDQGGNDGSGGDDRGELQGLSIVVVLNDLLFDAVEAEEGRFAVAKDSEDDEELLDGGDNQEPTKKHWQEAPDALRRAARAQEDESEFEGEASSHSEGAECEGDVRVSASEVCFDGRVEKLWIIVGIDEFKSVVFGGLEDERVRLLVDLDQLVQR